MSNFVYIMIFGYIYIMVELMMNEDFVMLNIMYNYIVFEFLCLKYFI